MEALDILKAARAKIADPMDWGKGRRKYDRPLETCCASEAIEEAGAPFGRDLSRAFRAVRNATAASALADWNDAPERTHAEVLAAFDLTIATLGLGAP